MRSTTDTDDRPLNQGPKAAEVALLAWGTAMTKSDESGKIDADHDAQRKEKLRAHIRGVLLKILA
jgi:hypothetical protein